MDRYLAYETRGPDGRARLIARDPAGDAHLLYEAPEDPEVRHRLTLDPNGRWLIIAETGGPAGRIGVLDLHTDRCRWLPPPGGGPWDLRDPVLADGGDRLCVAGRPSGLPLFEQFVYALDAETPQVVAGIALEGQHQAHAPVFLPGGRQLLYLRQGDSGVDLALLELDRPGESAAGIQGQAPSALRLSLTTGAQARTDVRPSYSPEGRRTAFAVNAPGGRFGLMVYSPGAAPRAIDGAWDRVDHLTADPAGRWLAFVDDARLWLGRLDAPHRGAVPIDGPRPTGPLRWSDDRLWFARGAQLCTLDPEAQAVQVEARATASVTRTFALPSDVRALARIARLGLDVPALPSDAAQAARDDLHTWFEGLGVLPDPVPAFSALAELGDDTLVRHLVDGHLSTQALRVRTGEPATAELLFALAAAGTIGVGRQAMRALCADARDRLAEGPALPKRPAFLALHALEADAFVLTDALAAYSALQVRWRAALALPEAEGRTEVEALVGDLHRRLEAAAQGEAAPVAAPTVDPKDAAVVARFTADRAAAERAHAARNAQLEARAAKAQAARKAAERARAIDRERAAREAERAAARAEAEQARAEAEALAAAREARKQRVAEQAAADAERAQVAALAAAAANRAEADDLLGRAAKPVRRAERDHSEERAQVAEAARDAAERARDLAEAERAAAVDARDTAEAEADLARDARDQAQATAKAAEATVATLQSRLKNVEARRVALAEESKTDLARVQAALDEALAAKESAEIHALQVAEAHRGGSPAIPMLLGALLAAAGVFGLDAAQLAQVPLWVGAAVGGAIGGLVGGIIVRP